MERITILFFGLNPKQLYKHKSIAIIFQKHVYTTTLIKINPKNQPIAGCFFFTIVIIYGLLGVLTN